MALPSPSLLMTNVRNLCFDVSTVCGFLRLEVLVPRVSKCFLQGIWKASLKLKLWLPSSNFLMPRGQQVKKGGATLSVVSPDLQEKWAQGKICLALG